ncbi:MAG: GTPase ObgE [Deltaproteobacteria bacterium]|nr:GTPase ObgE [Deltaproteobacteria bacterium]
MRFIDEVEIHVKAGDGGKGCVSFRRESHVPLGGPNGGDGGHGGDIIIEATRNASTLLDHRYQREYKAKRGVGGSGSDRHGRRGDPKTIQVPRGTMVVDTRNGELVGDLVDDGQQIVAAHGGRGGRGNARFVTSTQRAPREAEEGQAGEERWLRLELKLLAEVGLIGLPSSGKSTLISRVSKARPKIADYHFTTLVPNLGVVQIGSGADARSFVMADIPGLIKGAAEGAGLGHRFLKHVERTAVLVYLLDDRHHTVGEPGDPAEDLRILRRELDNYGIDLIAKPNLIVLNKIDSLDEARRSEVEDGLVHLAAELSTDFYAISAATGEGIPQLLEAIWPAVAAARNARDETDPERPPMTR